MNADIAGKRILVTGATGFIGGYVARRLHADGAHVLALERTPGKGDPLAQLGIEVVRGDIADGERMSALASQDIEVVMHIAAWLSGADIRNARPVNVDATRALAEASAAAGVKRFVYTSSIATYGSIGNHDVDETTPVAPFGDPYGDSKVLAERALKEVGDATGLPIVVVRPGMVYGPGSQGWTVRLARWAQRGTAPLLGGGKGTAFPVYIDNLVDLLLLCATHPDAPGQTFNAVDDGPVTFAEFLGGYMRMIPTERAIRVPCWVAWVAITLADPFVRRYKLSYVIGQMCGTGLIGNRKAKEVLGWQPLVRLDEGMARSEAWLRAEGIL